MRLLLLAPFALLLGGCDLEPWPDAPREFEEFSFDLSLRAGGRLTLENYNGPVEIRAWDKDQVEVRGSKYAASKEQLAEVRVEARAAGPDAVAIRTLPPAEGRGQTGARFTIRVPRRNAIEQLVTSNGAVRLEGLEGPGRVQTSNGAIRVGQHLGALDLSTSNGAIDIGGVTGPVTARTSNGRVSVEDLKGGLDAATANGSITATLLETPAEGPLRFATTNGSVTLKLRQAPRSDLRVQTSNGAVTVRLPEATNARVRLGTSNAAITNEFPLAGSGGVATRTRVDGKIGNGGPLVDIQTSNASIRLLHSGL
ncbi:MAG: DUF4097 family beta strand repeat-containing protein [Acidobacteria bacterium]|nr:DUF4097 family beta strand repeat-containing protein [Acidobacteriota bacterium]